MSSVLDLVFLYLLVEPFLFKIEWDLDGMGGSHSSSSLHMPHFVEGQKQLHSFGPIYI